MTTLTRVQQFSISLQRGWLRLLCFGKPKSNPACISVRTAVRICIKWFVLKSCTFWNFIFNFWFGHYHFISLWLDYDSTTIVVPHGFSWLNHKRADLRGTMIHVCYYNDCTTIALHYNPTIIVLVLWEAVNLPIHGGNSNHTTILLQFHSNCRPPDWTTIILQSDYISIAITIPKKF